MKYPICSLSQIVSPGEYYMISCNKEDVSEIINLEENMKKDMLDDNTSQFPLSCQMCVAVRDSEGKFRRGVIEKKLKDDLYEVFLVDYGKYIEANISQIRVITNKNFVKIEPLAFKVKLYGINPTKSVSKGVLREPRGCMDWRPDSKVFVQNLFKDYHRIIVQSIVIQQRVVYGDLHVQFKPTKKFVSLRKLLCKNKFCIYSESYFLQKEDLDSFSEKKLKFVKKWQIENFGVQKSGFELPVLHLETNEKERIYLKPATETSQNTGKIETDSLEQKKIGMGRGKIKLLIAEMNKKEVITDPVTSSSLLFQSDIKVDIKAPLGRGQLLKKCSERKKLHNSSPNISRVGSSSPQTNSTKRSSDRWSEIEFHLPETVSQIERPVLKSVNFFDSSDLIEKSFPANNESHTFSGSIKTEEEGDNAVLRDECSCLSECHLNSTSSVSTLKRDGSRKVESEKMETEEEHVKFDEYEKEKNIWEHKVTPNSCWAPYVVFDDSVVEPVKTFAELPIKTSVIKNLEKGGTFGHLSQVQRWAIPAIRKQLNTILIGSCKTGKTLSYVVTLIDYVQDEAYFEELPSGNGPSVVIVASSSRVCESIYYLCHSLLGLHTKHEISKSKIKVVLAHGGGCEKEIWVSLTNGCDVLISTPHCLVRLLEMPVLTNFERLTCLVLDQIDTICEKPFKTQTRIILEKAEFSARNRHYQKIFCGEKWTPKVQTLAKTYLNSYALVIGSYSEAVAYEGLKPRIYLVNRTQKPQILLDKLKGLVGESKIVVVCERTSEAVFLYEFLLENGIPSLLAHEGVMVDKLKDVGAIWNSSGSPVLVATDGVLTELGVREAETLIHFALPSKSKTNFYLRYLTLKDFLRHKRNFRKPKGESFNRELTDIILIDDENHYQLPHIVDFVARLGRKIPKKIVDKCQEIRRQIEIHKKNFPICENLLSFGRCRNETDCPRRHAFLNPRDSPGRLPASGWVNFVVLKTRDASCFSARLVEHVDDSGTTLKWDDCHLELPLKLSEFYKSEHNRRPHGTPEIGDVCAVRTEVLQQEIFFRAKVIEWLVLDKYEKPLEVNVRLLDRGDVWKQKSLELYELPEELSQYHPVAVDIRILGLQPMDFDVSWSQIANNFTGNLMSQKLQEGQYWTGKIALALENTLFLDPIKLKEFLPNLNAHVFHLTVREELLNSGIAVENAGHLPSLLRLCSEGGIEVHEREGTNKTNRSLIRPQWAFFDEDFIEVKFLAAENTSTVFLQPKKFEKLLLQLEEDCQKEGIKISGEGGKNRRITSETFCLALFEDGKWNRGRIESETEERYYVFFVDHGDFLSVPKENVVPIAESFLLRLPCQAIECTLVGIQEKEECPMDVLEKIYDFSEDGKEYLHAKIVKKDLQAKVTGGRKYSLNLVNKRGISLNKMLVDCGMVSVDESERKHLQDIQVVEEEIGENLPENIQEGKADVEEEGRVNPKEADLSKDYFTYLSDDLFEDEMAQEFLKEFASNVFNFLETSKEKLPPVTEDSNLTSSSDALEMGREIELNQTETAQNVPRLLDLGKKRRSKINREPALEGSVKVFTPQVLWCQNQMEVQMKILLGSVEDYSFECTVNNLSFRCYSREKLYGVDFRLYGAINPEMSKITLKAFHVLVVLTKLAFPTWPRIHADEGRLRWINLDVESLEDKDGVLSDKIKTAKQEIESGFLKKGFRSDNILPCSDSEGTNEFDESSDSESSERGD